MEKKEFSLDLGGRKLTAIFSNLAERAHGSAIVKSGETVVLATAVMSEHPREGGDFLPLTVEFEEKFYATGKILGSRFVRREGKPSDEAILSGRLVDRTIRPLFDQWIRNEIQVILTVLAIGEEEPDIIGVIAASLALGVSHIPWNGPVSAVRVADDAGNVILNPSPATREADGLNYELVACGRDGKVNMIELSGREISETAAVSALKKASAEIEKIQRFQAEIIAAIGVPKVAIPKQQPPAELSVLFEKEIRPLMPQYIMSGLPGDGRISELSALWREKVAAAKTAGMITETSTEGLVEGIFEEATNHFIHEEAVTHGRRPDGRAADEIRPLFAQAGGISAVLHGTGLFFRGQTHIFSALTLGGPQDTMLVEGLDAEKGKRFMHHYNFPPFSTGETGRVGGANRRMIGHGALAEKALTPVLPPHEMFPYTIRIVSEAFSSNGSTSMASVCGSTLALMDGGVPIIRPVAGISSGVMIHGNKHKVLTDIQGPEDHYGDMDFKVAGTAEGITAIQMDVKVGGISIDILEEAFAQAKTARIKILSTMKQAIAAPREAISPYAPKIIMMHIKQDQIGLVIGPGGKTIRSIQERTRAEGIDIEEDGTVFITGKNGTAEQAKKIIYNMTREFTKGERFEGIVTRVMDFGAFVKITENAEGLVHVSEIASFPIESPRSILKEGEKVPVIIKEIDEKKRINLSIKQADPDFITPPSTHGQ